MFRAVLFVFCALLAILASFFALRGWPVIPAAVLGAVLAVGLLIERYIYKPIQPCPPGPGWELTAERFADPRTGQYVVVYCNPKTGERRYVANGNG